MKAIRWTPKELDAYHRRDLARAFNDAAQAVASKVDTRRKYGNVPVDGKASKREAKRGHELRLMEKAGEIFNLQEQVKYVLIPRQNDKDGKCICRAVTYTADYQYEDKAGQLVVEDCKGYPNDRWPLKRSLMLWVHHILVREV